jgi:hypothetical protein
VNADLSSQPVFSAFITSISAGSLMMTGSVDCGKSFIG